MNWDKRIDDDKNYIDKVIQNDKEMKCKTKRLSEKKRYFCHACQGFTNDV